MGRGARCVRRYWRRRADARVSGHVRRLPESAMMKVVVVILSAVLALGSFKSAKALGLSIPPSLPGLRRRNAMMVRH